MIAISPELLTSLNLKESEAKVYLAALELGEATIQALAKKAGIKRTSIYNFIDDLKGRNILLESKKKKRTLYSAASPERLLELEKARLFELERVLPQLSAIENKTKSKPKVTFYEGVEGIKQVYADILRERKHISAFGDSEHAVKVMGAEYYDDYFIPERKKYELWYKTIMRDSEEARRYADKDNKEDRETKLLNKGDFGTEIDIYGNKVCLMSFRTTPPFAVIIENQDIAATLQTVWDNLWDKLDE